jgi:hypothetical protein
MNPLLFADWGRMNRLFTKIMWTVAAIMVCVVLAVLATASRPAHAARAPRAVGAQVSGAPAVGAQTRGGGVTGSAR